MKKSIFLGLATFAMLLTTSCVNEIAPSKEIGDTPVTFQIGTPEIATRAYSDGTTATKLQYAVYDEDGNLLDDLTVEDAEINGSTSIELQLATGNEYSIIFWAAAPNAPYTIDFAQKTMTVNYEGAICNDETRDAFYKCHTFTVRGAQTETIELKRPFAQLNIGTNDYEASEKAGYIPAYSYVKVPVSSVLNLFDGTVNKPEAVEFALSAIPTEEEFPVQGYEYISMNYLLVSAEKEVVDVTFGYSENIQTVENTRIVGSVPVQRNYRTNIYGQILTSNIDINVKIDPEYDEPANNVDLDATLATTLDDVKKVFANGGKLVLANDIKFEKLTPIEEGKEVYLDLNGKTITVDEKTASNTLIWVKDGAKLTIDGNGTIDLGSVSTMAIFCPYGELVINNGTFIRDKFTNTDDATGLFMGAKNSGCNVTINGGYFDSGYYDANAADIEEILAGNKTLTETADDIAKRGLPGDANLVRVAVKDNVSALLNHSGYGSFKVYGGTFVGANPAWGDEGCMLPTTPNYLRPWSYYQGTMLDGQTFNENGLVIPTGYEITKGTHADGRPTYTVTYNN